MNDFDRNLESDPFAWAVGLLAFAFFLLLFVDAASAEQAETVCADRSVLAQAFKEAFQEVPVARGLLRNGNMLEVFASTNSPHTFAVVVTPPGGETCVVTEGENFFFTPEALLAGDDA